MIDLQTSGSGEKLGWELRCLVVGWQAVEFMIKDIMIIAGSASTEVDLFKAFSSTEEFCKVSRESLTGGLGRSDSLQEQASYRKRSLKVDRKRRAPKMKEKTKKQIIAETTEQRNKETKKERKKETS